MAKFVKIFVDVSQPSTIGTTPLDVAVFAIPANTLVTDGDVITFNYWGGSSGVGAGRTLDSDIDGNNRTMQSFSGGLTWHLSIRIQRVSSTDMAVSRILYLNNVFVEQESDTYTPVDFTTAISTKMTMTNVGTGSMFMIGCDINKELI